MKSLMALIDEHKNSLGKNDYEFCKRVYKNGIDVYKTRLTQYGFTGYNKVLDAGCGFGQWSVALSGQNKKVYSIEYSHDRVEVFSRIIEHFNIDNIELCQGSIESLPYPSNFFDAIFCYGVIFLTDWKRSLNEIHRVLKPGGKLYVNANDIGWYVFLWETNHNKVDDYDPKLITVNAFNNSYEYSLLGKKTKAGDLIITESEMMEYLVKLGFEKPMIAEEGMLNYSENSKIKPFFMGKYRELPAVYEVMTNKK